MDTLKKPSNDHIGYLDSVRGIAALMVLFYHFINWHWKTDGAHLLSIAFNGADAVSFFFVLSGFVLSYKYLTLDHPLDIRKFYLNRIFRLFPGYMIAVLVMAIYWNSHPFATEGLKDLFIRNKQELYEELFLFRSHSKFYGAGWTLKIELIISLFVPFAVALAKQGRPILIALLVCFILEGNILLSHFHVHFVLGVILASYYYDISNGTIKQKKWYKYRYLLLLLAYFLYSFRHIDSIAPIPGLLRYTLSYFELDFFMFSGIASFFILALIISSPRTQKILDKGIWRFYGRLSYGIYLLHWFVVSYIFDHWDEYFRPHFSSSKVAFVVMLAACLATTTLFAYILHYTVELPFIRYGKRIVHKMKPSAIIK